MDAPISHQRSDQLPATSWQPYHEPLRTTLVRTILIGLVIGLIVARLQGQPEAWPHWTAFVLWFSFGGHWVELFFLNWLRPRLAPARWMQVAGRLVTWLIGGTLLLVGARSMFWLFGVQPFRLSLWWLGGLGFVGVEFLAHTGLVLLGRPSFYNGRG